MRVLKSTALSVAVAIVALSSASPATAAAGGVDVSTLPGVKTSFPNVGGKYIPEVPSIRALSGDPALLRTELQAYLWGEEERVLLRITDDSIDTKTKVFGVVSDVFQDEPLLVFARLSDIPSLQVMEVPFNVVQVDWAAELAEMRLNGMATFPDGSIMNPETGVRHYVDESGRLVDETLNSVRDSSIANPAFDDESWYQIFRPYLDIYAKFREYYDAAAQIPGLKATYTQVSRSYEGRDAYIMEFGGAKTNGTKVVHIQAQLHSREWLSAPTTLYFVREILKAYEDGDEDMVEWLDHVRLQVIPMTNPDGYEVNWFRGDRFWRKNRRPLGGPQGIVSTPGVRIGPCPYGAIGVDLNRNWQSIGYGGAGSSDDPCNDLYRGSKAFSEPETNAISEYTALQKANGVDFLVGLDIHTYTALILRPIGWGFIGVDACPANQAYLMRFGAKLEEAFETANGGTVNYLNVSPANGLYIADGIAGDWFFEELTDYRNGFDYELRPDRESIYAAGILTGFAPLPNEIIPSGIESFASVKVIIKDAWEVATGQMPRIVKDEEYLDFYGDEGYYTDDNETPKAPENCIDFEEPFFGPDSSCRNRCGGVAPSGCSCDDMCDLNAANCCPDKKLQCGRLDENRVAFVREVMRSQYESRVTLNQQADDQAAAAATPTTTTHPPPAREQAPLPPAREPEAPSNAQGTRGGESESSASGVSVGVVAGVGAGVGVVALGVIGLLARKVQGLKAENERLRVQNSVQA